MADKSPDWQQFEVAVCRFVEALGSGARVTHDVRLPDVHTGYPRQRDVWVEWLIAGHYPVKALISCKDWSTALDEQDIDHFNGEFISSGAQLGIIYARTGFNGRAIEKARKLNFHCCKLYKDQPADLPQMLILGLAYCFYPSFWISLQGAVQAYQLRDWKDLFAIETEGMTVRDFIARELDYFQRACEPPEGWRLSREGHVAVLGVRGQAPLDISLHCAYRAFQAKIEYTMLNGSYNMTAGMFSGSQSTPVVDTKSTHPGPGWTQISDLPEHMPKPAIAIYLRSDSTEELDALGEKAFSSEQTRQ